MERVFRDIRAVLTGWAMGKHLEVALSLFILPLILNCFMFWMVDNILMKAIRRRSDTYEVVEDEEVINQVDGNRSVLAGENDDDPLVPV